MKTIFTLVCVDLLFITGLSTAAPLNVVIVLDGSGSMGGRFSGDRSITRMEAAKKALIEVLGKIPKEDSNVGLVVFSRNQDGWAYPLGPLNKQQLFNSINSISEGGGTPLGQYMKEGANALLKLREKNKYGIYKLIVVTDGESNDDAITPVNGQYGILSKGLKIEVIGVDMAKDHTLSKCAPYRNASNPDALTNAVKEVLAESSGSGHSEDYDVIASIDPQIAMAAIQALAEPDNGPIGMKPVINSDGTVDYQVEGASIFKTFVIGVAIAVVVILGVVGIIWVIIKLNEV